MNNYLNLMLRKFSGLSPLMKIVVGGFAIAAIGNLGRLAFPNIIAATRATVVTDGPWKAGTFVYAKTIRYPGASGSVYQITHAASGTAFKLLVLRDGSNVVQLRGTRATDGSLYNVPLFADSGDTVLFYPEDLTT